MTTPVPQSPRSRSQAGGRRSTSRSGGPPSHLHSDCPPELENTTNSPSLGQRSVSLTTLQPTVIQPRMAQLETLEAKMASIEVSLSNTPRRKKNGSLNGLNLGSSIRSIPKELAVKELENLRSALRDKENIIQSLKGQLTVPGLRLNGVRNTNNCKTNLELTEVEKKQAEDRLWRLKTDTDNKRLVIKNLKLALERLDITDNIDVRIQQAELEYQLGREELNILTLLEETRTLQICLEESNKNSSDSHTLYNTVNGSDYVILQAFEVNYDPKSPKFVAGQKDSLPGLWIDWALEETGMIKGDRLVEVNGKIVLTKSRDDLTRLLAAAPDPAQIVLLRKLNENSNIPIQPNIASKEITALRSELEIVRDRAEEAQRIKDGLRSDNIRLTHRISYLEEQVSELLNRKTDSDIRIVTPTPVISTVKTNQNVTNINITSQPLNGCTNTKSDVQVFQKGPQVTTLVSNVPGLESREQSVSLPIRSKSSLSNVSNTHIPAPSPQPDYHCHKNHRHKHRSSRNSVHSSIPDQTTDKMIYRKHHHHHRDKDYNSEANSTTDHVLKQNKRNTDCQRHSTNGEKEFASDVMDQSYKKATKIVHELTRNNRVDTSLYEKHRQKCITASEKYNSDILKHYNARKSTSVLDFRSEVHIGPKYSDSKSVENLDVIDSTKNTNRLYKKIQDSRSIKHLDFDSDCNSTSTSCRNGHTKSVDYTSEPIDNRKLSYYQGYYVDHIKPRPTPPKKPLRLSLHKTQSLHSVEVPPVVPGDSSSSKHDSRKSLKRNYKGEVPSCLAQNGDVMGYRDSGMKWTNYKRGNERNVEKSSWC